MGESELLGAANILSAVHEGLWRQDLVLLCSTERIKNGKNSPVIF